MPNRQFNVYSPSIVVVPRENFHWVLNSAEAPSVTVQPATGGSWPLTASQYSVTAGTPVAASVSSSALAGTYTFQCTPPAPNVTSQQIVVAALDFVTVCSTFTLKPGDYFIWYNNTTSEVTITPDPDNDDFWPLGSQSHTMGPHGHIALQIPASAAPDKEYALVVTFTGGSGCTQNTQPKLIVSGSGME